MIGSEPQFKIGDMVTHKGYKLLHELNPVGEDGKTPILGRGQSGFFIVSILQESCPAGVQTHYYVRGILDSRYGEAASTKDLMRFNEVELVLMEQLEPEKK